MSPQINEKTLHRLDVQGFDSVPVETMAPLASWLRLPFVLCASLAIGGVALGSPQILTGLAVIALLAAIFPVHPFDLIYNHGIRQFTGTGPFPRRGAPGRFACGMGSVWLVATAWFFASGQTTVAQVLGFTLVGIASLVAATNICIPSLIFRAVFGQPQRRDSRTEGVGDSVAA